MYWLDAYEDPFKHAGTVWLFGKVYIEKAKAHVRWGHRTKGKNCALFLFFSYSGPKQ